MFDSFYLNLSKFKILLRYYGTIKYMISTAIHEMLTLSRNSISFFYHNRNYIIYLSEKNVIMSIINNCFIAQFDLHLITFNLIQLITIYG